MTDPVGENGTAPTGAPVFDAVLNRRSRSSVTDEAPDDTEVLRLLGAAGRVADHGSLRPWRAIALRGDARERLGAALAEAAGDRKPSSKPLRAPLLLAVVARHLPSKKAPAWEQEATASGVAHVLTLLLEEAGWGVLWRTGDQVRSEPVRRLHDLEPNEHLLGWLYVGAVEEDRKRAKLKTVPAAEHYRVL